MSEGYFGCEQNIIDLYSANDDLEILSTGLLQSNIELQ